MRITPTQTTFGRSGPPPSFGIETGGLRFFAVQLATHAYLMNGAAHSRRTTKNFFDSWIGDEKLASWVPRALRREVAGQHLEAPTGRSTYSLPGVVWKRFEVAPRLYYRLIGYADEGRGPSSLSIEDVDWARAPAVSIARVPAQPGRSPIGRFRGRGVLDRPGLLDQVRGQLGNPAIVQGRSGPFRYAFLDARRFHTTVLECHEWGLTDTVDKMPRKPDAIINGQFISSAIGIGTEGQVIREGRLINSNSQRTRYYVAQTWRGSSVADYHAGKGNPATTEPDARVAFGGLGPVVLGGSPVTALTPWARDIYARPATTGRGVVAIDRSRGLILLLVQEDLNIWSGAGMRMADLRRWLVRHGFDDAVFNDGSDSESLYAGSGWLLTPGWAKDEAMDFAIAFVDRQANRRIRVLTIDGTRTPDGEAFSDGVDRPLITHYSPRAISHDLSALPALSALSTTFRSGIIEAWRATRQPQANLIGRIIELAGYGGHWADILYVSSHAWRHGQLWYYSNDRHGNPKRMIADLWSPGFRPVWRNTPKWLVIAGCAVLAVRYSRGLQLTTVERNHLIDWHRDMHGGTAATRVRNQARGKATLFSVYHPGWAWYHRVFRSSSSLRGVLGYWYRSPGSGIDADIMREFTEKLCEGETILEAWEAANRRSWYQAEAAWAAMVREGCEGDTLATLEDPHLASPEGDFEYYDRFQRGRPIRDAYNHANRLTDSKRVGSSTVSYNSDYDEFAIEELEGLSPAPTSADLFSYDDGIGP